MFCPACGLNEDRPVQFCRACGADLRAVRESLERAEPAEPSVVAAREEITRAIAARIKEGEWWQVGAMVPEVEKLFESPRERRERLRRQDEERRLARARAGTITAAVGLGLVVLFSLLCALDERAFFLLGPSVLVFLVGLGVIINGLFFTTPKGSRQHGASPDMQPAHVPGISTSELDAPRELGAPGSTPFVRASVTEQTTQHLSGEVFKTQGRG